jgi:hypothetical protein
MWDGSNVTTIDPRNGRSWPDPIDEIYQQSWLRSQRPHRENSRSGAHEMCNKVSFMFGSPYREQNLVPEIHADTWSLSFKNGSHAPRRGERVEGERASGILHDIKVKSGTWASGNAAGVMWLQEVTGKFESNGRLRVGNTPVALSTGARFDEAQLPKQFGAIPLRMYLQVAKNVVRGGRAADFSTLPNARGFTDAGFRAAFDRLQKTTLITGKENRLWLPDSVDDMCEWLSNGKPRRVPISESIRGYGHQDLLWGKSAREDVFPYIEKGLGPSA